MVSPFFGPEIGEDQKEKRSSPKSSGFSVQKQVKTKTEKGLRRKLTGFLVQMRLETKQNDKNKVFTSNL